MTQEMRAQAYERDQKLIETKFQSGLVSIVIPTYNREGVLGRAIQSVLDDSYPTKEIIVVDDGSVDNTPKVVEQLKNATSTPVKFLPLSHSGHGKSRNVGMNFSKGEYILFLDSDDFLLNNKIAKSVKVFQEHPLLQMVCTDWYQRKGAIQKVDQASYQDIQKLVEGNFKHPTCAIQTTAALWKRSFLWNNKLQWNEELSAWVDLLFYFQAITKLEDMGNLYHLAEPLYVWVRGEQGSISTNRNSEGHILAELSAYQILYEECGHRGLAANIREHYLGSLKDWLHRSLEIESHLVWKAVLRRFCEIREGMKPRMLGFLPFNFLVYGWKSGTFCIICRGKHKQSEHEKRWRMTC